mgnify:CR=1 FL=1
MSMNSKINALGDALKVTDDTRDIERPKQGRGVSDVLRDKTVVDDDDPIADPPADLTPAPEVRSKQPKPPTTRRPSADRVKATPSATGAAKKTSATIPVSVVKRLRDAKHKRWDLVRLVSAALAASNTGSVTMAEAEAFLEKSAGEPRGVESIRMPLEDLDTLDKLGDDWRMSRSQVLSAVLDSQLKTIGF